MVAKMSRYWSPLVETLEPYVAGEQPKHPHLVKLNTNESPYGPLPAALKASARSVSKPKRRGCRVSARPMSCTQSSSPSRAARQCLPFSTA